MSYLALQGPLEGRQRNYVEKVHGAAESLLRIINDILDFSKIEAGKLEIESADFALGDVLDQLANLLGVAAEEKGLQLLFELPPDLPTALVGDASRLGQILLNLGNNALKFTERGRVTVAVALVERTPERATLRFEVRDTGIGMTAQACERLFQPFTQADASTSRRYGGTGLGLAICRHLVERMGGTIGVDSEPGRGSSFHFTLPFGLQPRGSPAAPSGGRQDAQQDPRAGLAGTRVLLVEDNVLNQELACDLLEGAGIEVAVAADGRQALDALERERYDAVLMDCQMPVMDGYEATRALRQRAELKDLPVIAMTANAMAGDREKVIAAGMNDHVAKPIHVDELFAALARWVVRGGEPSAHVQRAAGQDG
jgi:CheY-like chemotaxis protein